MVGQTARQKDIQSTMAQHSLYRKVVALAFFFFTQADLKEQYQTIFSEKKYYELLINNTEVDK